MVKMVKKKRLLVSPGDGMYSMVTTVNNTVLHT